MFSHSFHTLETIEFRLSAEPTAQDVETTTAYVSRNQTHVDELANMYCIDSWFSI